MEYVDTDVLIHSLVNQNPNMQVKANDLIEDMIKITGFLFHKFKEIIDSD